MIQSVIVAMLIALPVEGHFGGRGGGAAGLAPAYVDGHFGFSIRPPREWQLIRPRGSRAEGGVLLRMAERIPPNRYHEISLRLAPSKPGQTMQELLDAEHYGLVLEFNNVKTDATRLQEIAGKPGAFLSAAFDSEGSRMLRLEAIVEQAPDRRLMLTYQGPADLRSEAEPLFNSVMASLKPLEERFDKAAIAKALNDGALWAHDIAPQDLRKLIGYEAYFQVELDGKLIGMYGMQCRARQRDEAEGIELRERSWMFSDNGGAQRTQANQFLSFDLTHEKWHSSASGLVPGQKGQQDALDVALESGLREDTVLLSNQCYELSMPDESNPVVDLPPAYISRPLLRLFPMLARKLGEPRTLAFAAFDHRRVDLVIHVIEMKGESKLPEGASRGPVYRIDDQEGLAGEPMRLYVDSSGKLLRMESGSLTLKPADRQAMERQFAGKIAEADRRMNAFEQAYRADLERFERGEPKPAPKATSPPKPR